MVLGGKWHSWKIFTGAALLTIFTGCTTVVVHGPDHVRGALANDNRNDLAEHNSTISDKFAEEAKLYPRNSGSTLASRPKTCVSFSGGGIRSAAFSIGVMKGLHELNAQLDPDTKLSKGFFDQVDVISGVSGGSYAVTWYYMNQMSGSYDRHTIFKDPPESNSSNSQSNALSYLQNHADFIGWPRKVLSGITDIALIPLNFLANGIFGWHLNTSGGATSFYEAAITRTFHGGKTAELPDLRKFLMIQKDRLPIPIVTATWRVDEDQFNEQAKLSNTVLEVTPLWYGSEGLGYTNPYGVANKNQTTKEETAFPFTSIAELVEISGSALDSTQGVPGASQRVVTSALNFDTGRFYDNAYEARRQGEVERSFWSKVSRIVSFFPLYLTREAYLRDAYGERIYLSDGGHTENLAAWPLVRRLCENIIVVDAEYDPNYTFEAYFRFKHAVEREMHVSMQLQPEEVNKNNETGLLDVDKIESSLEMLRRQQNTKDSDKKKELERTVSAQFYPHDKAVIAGSIGPFPVKGLPPDDKLTLQVTYIKMALNESLSDEKISDKYGKKAQDYFSKTCGDERPSTPSELLGWGCEFPQYDTIHQNYTSKQFAAYVDLGANIVKNQIAYCGKGILVPMRWHGCTPPPLLPTPALTQ